MKHILKIIFFIFLTSSVYSRAADGYIITATAPGGNGTISCESPVLAGSNSVCTINADTGFYLSSLTDSDVPVDGYLVGNTYTFRNVITDHPNIVATFSPGSHAIDLPQTGIKGCYDSSGANVPCSGSGQDAEFLQGVSAPNPRFIKHNDGTITDTLTGLMWLEDGTCLGLLKWINIFPRVQGFNNNPAASYLCRNYSASYDDWRIPNVNEFSSLINPDATNMYNWLSSLGFKDAGNCYWTSDYILQGVIYSAYSFCTNGGDFFIGGISTSRYTWAVRGRSSSPAEIWKTGKKTCNNSSGAEVNCQGTGQDGEYQAGAAWPAPRFVDLQDGSIKDNLTGLIWLKNTNCMETNYPTYGMSGGVLWDSALNFIKGINDRTYSACNANHSDWRLPNLMELQSLIDYSQTNPSLPNGHPFVNVETNKSYWTSTTKRYLIPSGDTAYAVGFNSGLIGGAYKSQYYGGLYVWPVRAGSGYYGLPHLTISPGTNDFGIVDPSTSSPVADITLLNDSNNKVFITTISMSGGNSDQFQISDASDCTGNTLGPNDSCIVRIYFAPITGGFKQSQLSVSSNISGGTQSTLTGTGRQYRLDITGTAGTSTGSITGGNSINCTVASDGNASGTCMELRDPGTVVSLTATQAPCTSVIWSGCSVSAGNSCSVGLNQNKTVSVAFNFSICNVTENSVGNGTVSCPANVSYNSATECTIQANTGYHIASVSGCSGTPVGPFLYDVLSFNYQTGTITTDCEVSAIFTINSLVRKLGPDTTYYPNITDAYIASSAGDTIDLRASTFIEDVNFSKNVSITIRGGYDTSFSSRAGNSAVKGLFTISLGTVNIDKISIE